MQHGKRIFFRRQSAWRQWVPALLTALVLCAAVGAVYVFLGDARPVRGNATFATLPDCDSRESELALRQALLHGLPGQANDAPTQLRDLHEATVDSGQARPGVRPCVASVQVGHENRRIPFQIVPIEQEGGFTLLLPET